MSRSGGGAATTYDEVPYEAVPAYETHPDRMATAALLMGLHPPSLDRCRVLELGCANGGNLLPIAESLPNGRFVGVDLSRRQIEEGLELARAGEVNNLELYAGAIGEIDLGEAEFDYIICHGVYSWVPESVQNRIFQVCRRMLAKNGIAYISYNTYPGWHRRGVLRDALLFHTERATDPREKIRQSRDLLDLLDEAVGDNDYGRVLKSETQNLRKRSDAYLFHEHLEDRNQPVYFHEFMRRAAENGFQYLGESALETVVGDLPEAVQEKIRRASTTRVALEQYLDFIRNRTFRRSLLCHADAVLDPSVGPQVVPQLLVRGLAAPKDEPVDIRAQSDATFSSERNVFTTDSPLIKAVLMALYDERPRVLDADALWGQVAERLGTGAAQFDRATLAQAVLRCHRSNLVALHVHAPRFVVEPGVRPRASEAARLQAGRDVPICNLLHQIVELGALDRAILAFLDGERDRAGLLDALGEAVKIRALEIEHEGAVVEEPVALRALLGPMVDRALCRLGESAMLIE